ncbi:hypothetical protein SNK05_008488 [Fusarium graminearum]
MYGPMDDAVTLHSCQVNPFGYEVVSTFETEPAAADAEICAEFIRMPCWKHNDGVSCDTTFKPIVSINDFRPTRPRKRAIMDFNTQLSPVSGSIILPFLNEFLFRMTRPTSGKATSQSGCSLIQVFDSHAVAEDPVAD